MAGEVRQPIDQAKLEKYIDGNVPEIKTPCQLKQFGFGQSNPTYQITDSNQKRFVLRKKPPGKLLSKTAHRVDREYLVIHALSTTDVPVPVAYALCEDASILGTPFYIMSFLNGRFISNPSFPGVSHSDRRAMWRDAVRTLAKLHRVDYASVGLEKFGRASGFYDRQIKTFTSLAESQASARDVEMEEPVGQLPHFRDLLAYFSSPASQPKDRGVLYHGDFKIDNLVFHPTLPRVIGILDWEMATIGHPLADLTNLLQPWTISRSTPSWPRIHADEAFLPPSHPLSTAASHPGLPTREECIAWYQSDVGFTVTERDVAWATAFALFRDSIIFQGIAARFAMRQASSGQARRYGDERGVFAEMAWGKVGEAKMKEGSGARL